MNNIIENKIVKQTAGSVNMILTRYFKITAFALVAAIFALGFFFLIEPKYKNIISKNKKVITAEYLKYEERLKYLNELKKIKANFKIINAEDIKKIKALAPTRLYHEELLAQLEKIILENGLLLNSIAITEAGSDNASNANSPEGGENAVQAGSGFQAKRIKINMSITGTDYIGLKNLLYIMENNLRLIDIVSLSADTKNKTTSIDAYAYYLE
jgi:hypothetical protein